MIVIASRQVTVAVCGGLVSAPLHGMHLIPGTQTSLSKLCYFRITRLESIQSSGILEREM